MKDLKITKGELFEVVNYSDTFCPSTVMVDGKIVCDTFYLDGGTDITVDEEITANAELISDAFNTAQKCNLLPSELLEQRDELLKACNKLISASKGCKDYRIKYREAFEEIKQAIKKAQQ